MKCPECGSEMQWLGLKPTATNSWEDVWLCVTPEMHEEKVGEKHG